MFCVECGSRVADGGKFCQECGAPVKKTCHTSDSEDLPCLIKPKGSNLQSSPFVKSKKMEENLAMLKAKFNESKKKMSQRRQQKGIKTATKPSTGLETLEVRFIDADEKRMQRLFPGGASYLNINVESASSSEEWMQMVRSMFKKNFTMHPVLQRGGKYEDLPSGSTLDYVKSISKGKHKHHGFYVKVFGSRRQLLKNLISKNEANRDGKIDISQSSKNEANRDGKDISQSSLQPEEVKDITDFDSDNIEDELWSKPKRRKNTSISTLGDTSQQTKKDLAQPGTSTPIHGNIVNLEMNEDIDLSGSSPSLNKKKEKQLTKKDLAQPGTSTPIHGNIVNLEMNEDIDLSGSSPSSKKKEKQLIIDNFLEDLPDLEKDPSIKKGKRSTDDEGVEFLKDFEEIMQKKKERQAFAESMVIDFPMMDEGRRRINVVYESHGRLGLSRPFKLEDTLRSVYIWILTDVQAEILPPVFHFECKRPTKCTTRNCPHIWELEKDHEQKITDLPSVMYLREGCFAVNDTFTGFGDVLFSGVH